MYDYCQIMFILYLYFSHWQFNLCLSDDDPPAPQINQVDTYIVCQNLCTRARFYLRCTSPFSSRARTHTVSFNWSAQRRNNFCGSSQLRGLSKDALKVYSSLTPPLPDVLRVLTPSPERPHFFLKFLNKIYNHDLKLNGKYAKGAFTNDVITNPISN